MENKEFFLKIYTELEWLFKQSIKEKFFPGAVVGISIFSGTKKEIFLAAFGSVEYDGLPLSKEIFYDLASLTKPLATTLAVISLLKNKILDLQDTLPDLLEIELPKDKKNIKIIHLLGHCSGLPAYRPYFKDLAGKKKYSGSAMIKKIMDENLTYKTGKRQLYSDLGFMLIGEIIKKKTSLRLDEYVNKKIYEPMGIDKLLFFNFDNKIRKGVNFAPTELCNWRKKLLYGQVHDDNAFMMQGVAGHAGMFGNVYGVTALVNYLIDIIEGKKDHPNINREDLNTFIKKNKKNESFGLGFDTPSSENSSSGHCFSDKSFGHLGFTGTSFWVDLEKKISIVLLTNRVHPDRENEKIRKLRPIFHDLIMNKLMERKIRNEQ